MSDPNIDHVYFVDNYWIQGILRMAHALVVLFALLQALLITLFNTIF